MSIRVVVADDQGMVRSGLRSLIEQEADMDVVAEAADGRAAVAAVARHAPNVVLMDIRMPVLDGIAATRELVAAGTPARILILTTFDLDEHLFAALRGGAAGFLLKDAPAEELVDAIRSVAVGDGLLAPSLTRRVIEEFARAPSPSHAARAGLGQLTGREIQVLTLLARGRSNAEIARELFVSEATVKTHVSNVLAKLSLRDRVQAVIAAYESGLVSIGDSRSDPG